MPLSSMPVNAINKNVGIEVYFSPLMQSSHKGPLTQIVSPLPPGEATRILVVCFTQL